MVLIHLRWRFWAAHQLVCNASFFFFLYTSLWLKSNIDFIEQARLSNKSIRSVPLFTIVPPWDGGGHVSGLPPPSGSPSQADPQQPHCRIPQEDHPREWWVIILDSHSHHTSICFIWMLSLNSTIHRKQSLNWNKEMDHNGATSLKKKQLYIYMTQCTGIISNVFFFVNLYLYKLSVSMFHQFVATTLQTMLLPAWSLCYGRSRKMENWKNDGNKTPQPAPIYTQTQPKKYIVMQIWQSLIFV